jgi:hypothetical protein
VVFNDCERNRYARKPEATRRFRFAHGSGYNQEPDGFRVSIDS